MADIRRLARDLARSMYDPARDQGVYRAEKKRLRDSFYDDMAAQTALPGSIAEANDPNRFGSVAGRFGGPFYNDGISVSEDTGLIEGIDNPAVTGPRKAKSKLRRQAPFDFQAAADMLGTDDLFGEEF